MMLLLSDKKGIRPVKNWWDAGVVICLRWGTNLHMTSWCHCHSISLAPVNPDWFYLSGTNLPRVVPDKIQKAIKRYSSSSVVKSRAWKQTAPCMVRVSQVCIVKPHHPHIMHSFGLLLQMSHVVLCVGHNGTKKVNQSRCHLGCRFVCTLGTRYQMGSRSPTRKKGHFRGWQWDLPSDWLYGSLLSNYFWHLFQQCLLHLTAPKENGNGLSRQV